MTAPWHKAIRDIWCERSRAASVVLAVAVGLTGLVTVLSSYAVLLRELNTGYQATNPAHLVVHTDGVDTDTLAEVMARDDVRDADMRRLVNGRVRVRGTEWRRLILFVIRDFEQLRINRVTPDRGAWPPAAGDVLIERDALQVAKAAIGDTIAIELIRGRSQTLRIAGTAHDAGQAQARMENMVYGYITPAALQAMTGTASLDRLHLVVEGNTRDVAHLAAIGSAVKAFLEPRGITVTRVEVPPPAEHPHAGIMNLLLTTMAVFGVFVVGLSGIVVANLMLSILARERRQIGIMKALGGTRGQIAAIYFGQAVVLGAAAVALATPVGLVAGRMLSGRLAVLLNFDLVSLANPLWVYLAAAGVGVMVPLLSAAYPIAEATAVTVRAALAPGDAAPAYTPGHIDRVLLRMDGIAQPLLLGVRNSLRRRTRTFLTVGTLAMAGACFMTARNARMAMIAALDVRFGPASAGSEARYAFDQHLLMVYVFLMVVAGLLAAIGGLGAMTASGINVFDRRRELGVMRAIGASPLTIAAIVAIEGTFVAVLAALVAVAAALPSSAFVGGLLTSLMFRDGLRVAFDWPAVAAWFAFSLALGIVSSIVPAVAASRQSIREVISHE